MSMKFKVVNGRGYTTSYQCYGFDTYKNEYVRVARIDEPICQSLRAYADQYSVNFVGGYGNGNVTNLLKITNKIKLLAKSYREVSKAKSKGDDNE